MDHIEKYTLYGGEVILTFNPKTHIYTVDDEKNGLKGFRPDSVTGITGIADKSGALMGWAVKMGAEFLEEQLKPGVALDEVQIKELISDMKRQHRIKKERAADVGTLVHDWIEQYIKASLGMPGFRKPDFPINEMMKNAVNAFFDWRDQTHLVFHRSEEKIYSRKYRYAGTLDLEADVEEDLCIVDFKTSNGVWPEYKLQTAGYQQARQEETGKKYTHRWIIRFGKEDAALEALKVDGFAKDIKGFLGAQALASRIKELKYA